MPTNPPAGRRRRSRCTGRRSSGARPSSAPTIPIRSEPRQPRAAYESLGRWAEAERLLRDVLARRRKTDPPDSPLLADDLADLGRDLLMQARWSEAEPLLRESLAIREKATPDDWQRYDAMSLLGGALLGQGRYAEAEPLIVAGYEGMKAREARMLPEDKVRPPRGGGAGDPALRGVGPGRSGRRVEVEARAGRPACRRVRPRVSGFGGRRTRPRDRKDTRAKTQEPTTCGPLRFVGVAFRMERRDHLAAHRLP